MHKIIILFITAILVITAPIDSFAGKGATSKTKQKVEKQAEQNKASKYSKIPFALSGNIIPLDYLGHDLREVYKSLEFRMNKQKNEFETTDEFYERKDREDKLPLIGSINLSDNFALLVKSKSKYDADNKSLIILLPLQESWTKKFELGIKGQEIYNRKKMYVGSNAFGATAKITEYSTSDAILVVKNSSSYDFDQSSYRTNQYMYVTLNDVSVENAKKIKDNLSTICVFKLDSPFIGEDVYYSEATIDHPTKMVISNNLVYGNISEIIVFNNKSGEILRRIANK